MPCRPNDRRTAREGLRVWLILLIAFGILGGLGCDPSTQATSGSEATTPPSAQAPREPGTEERDAQAEDQGKAQAEAEGNPAAANPPAPPVTNVVVDRLPPESEAQVRYRLDSRGLRSLKALGLGFDEHEFIHQKKDFQGDGRGDFKPMVRYRRPNGKTYRIDYWPGSKTKRTMDHEQGVLKWELYDGPGATAGAFEVRYHAQGSVMFFEVTYTHWHRADTPTEVSAGLAALQLPGQVRRRWNEISNASVLDFGSGQLVAMSMQAAPGFEASLRGQRHGVGLGLSFSGETITSLRPGESVSATMQLHFLPAEADPMLVADQAYEAWRERFPFAMSWDDHRPIGALFMAKPKMGWKTNPNGFFSDPEVDVTTEEGLAAFRKRLLELADRTAQIANDTDAQGVIVWDLEGARHGHPTTYIGDPRQLDAVAPEMQWRPDPDAKPTADAFFEVFDKAGLKTGLTVRPQKFIPGDERSHAWRHNFLDEADALDILDKKIGYAKERWDIDIIYIDTSIYQDDGKHKQPAATFKALQEKYPDVLLIPEYGPSARHHAYCAPYGELDMGKKLTRGAYRRAYPQAFSTINIMDGNQDAHRELILAGAQRGDLLIFRSWYHDKSQRWVKALREEIAGADESIPPEAPTLHEPLHNVVLANARPRLSWYPAHDPSGLGGYEVQINKTRHEAGVEPVFVAPQPLPTGTHTWRVRAIDAKGNTGPWSRTKRFAIQAEAPPATR